MPGPPSTFRPTDGETAALVTQLVDELARRLAQEAAHPPAEPLDMT